MYLTRGPHPPSMPDRCCMLCFQLMDQIPDLGHDLHPMLSFITYFFRKAEQILPI